MTDAASAPDAPRIGAGDVPIKIDGEDLVLVPSFSAAKVLSARYGGLTVAIDRIGKLDVDVITDVLMLGLGYGQTRRPPADLPERIWRTGFTDESGLAARCVDYLYVLMNGGRPPARGEGDQPAPRPPTAS